MTCVAAAARHIEAARPEVARSGADPALENPYLLAMARLALAQRRPAEAKELLSRVHRAAYPAALPFVPDGVRRQMLLAQACLLDGGDAEALPAARSALAAVQASALRPYLGTLETEAALPLGETERRSGLGLERLGRPARCPITHGASCDTTTSSKAKRSGRGAASRERYRNPA